MSENDGNSAATEPLYREALMFIDSQTSTLQFIADQTVQWLNHLTLPVLALAAWKALRWVNKKEREGKAVITGFQEQLNTIRTNDMHHLQLALDDLKNGQQETIKLMNENTKDIVAAINNSKDALVNAFLASKN